MTKQLLETQSMHSISLGKTEIPFQLAFTNKRQLSVSVLPNGSVVVVAPRGHTAESVLKAVQKKAVWIAKKKDYFEQFHPWPSEKQFVSGETHHYLGRQYRLKIIKQNDLDVKLIGQYFYVSTHYVSNADNVKNQMDQWYLKRAKSVFANKIKVCLEKLPSLKVFPRQITIRRMERRWGSCTKAGNICLNLDLIKLPLHCIEYVIAHELCHLKVHDHSPFFFRLLARIMPDWKKRKKRLDSIILS